MPELMESKPSKLRVTMRKAVFVPRVMGIFILLIIILGITVGVIRQELAPVLAGAVLLALWVYCLLMTLLLALIHNRRARCGFIRISPREITAGDSAEALYVEGETAIHQSRIFQLPGILVRCRMLLVTRDGRQIKHSFNPAGSMPYLFIAEKRGAYFSPYNEFAIFDILGFFYFAFRLPAENAVRENTVLSDNPQLLVSPHAADEPLAASARAGESKLKPEFSLQRTDDLIDHRPYVPGDDSRRINWKLYGHGGGLFVRDGEHEPPQSNIIILIDTEYDPLLYSASSARHGIDMLCENALATALACTESGMNVFIGYPGNAGQSNVIVHGNKATEFTTALAWPAAAPLPVSQELPAVFEGYGILVLALPRSSAAASALDHFVNNNRARTINVLFFCGHTDNTVIYSERLAAAEVCVALYNQRPGIRAKVMAGN